MSIPLYKHLGLGILRLLISKFYCTASSATCYDPTTAHGLRLPDKDSRHCRRLRQTTSALPVLAAIYPPPPVPPSLPVEISSAANIDRSLDALEDGG